MENTTLDFIYLFRCALHGTTPSKAGYDLEKIKKLADQHNAWPLIFLPLKEAYGDEDPCENWHEYRSSFFYLCVKNMQRMYGLRKILSAFDKASIPYAILKGESLASLYPHPECRISSDIDLYVAPEDESRAVDILLSRGVEVKPRIPHGHHRNCKSKVCGKIELHIQWQGDLQNDILYNGKLKSTENFMQMQTEALGSFYTLGVNDGLYMHFAHLTTHFVAGGFGIRLVSDLLLYIRKHKNVIHWDNFNAFLSKLGYTMFFNALLCLGIKYLGFETSDFPQCNCEEDTVDLLMEDCISGGAFGHAEAGRFGTHEVVLSSRAKDFDSYTSQYQAQSNKSKLSFSVNNIKNLYNYVRKNTWLLPVAYLHHIGFIAGKATQKLFKKQKKQPAPMHENAQKRILLLEKLEIKK